MSHEPRKHKNIRRLISRYEHEIENIRTLPYYRIFNRRAEQEADIRELQLKITSLKLQITNTINYINPSTTSTVSTITRLDLNIIHHDDHHRNN